MRYFSVLLIALLSLNTNALAGYSAGGSTSDATAANQVIGNSSLSSIDGKVPAKGTAVISGSTPVNIASDQTVPVSAASLPLPAGAATSAKQPALGSAATAASTPVNIASDQTVPVSAALDSTSSATLTQVAGSATSVSVLASNAARKGAIFFNASTQICYLAFAATATSSAYTVQMAANSTYIMDKPIYTGVVSGIWVSANGNMIITAL